MTVKTYDPADKNVADYDAERTMAFKRIMQTFKERRRQCKEMLKWDNEHPSPRTSRERLLNLKRAIWS